jgi:hypothetical protein
MEVTYRRPPWLSGSYHPRRELQQALPRSTTLEAMNFYQLEFACGTCQGMRDWAWAEMDSRVQRVLAGEPTTDQTMLHGACSGLWKAMQQLEGETGLEREVADFLGDTMTSLNLSGITMAESAWKGILGKVAELTSLVELNLTGCRMQGC